MRSVLLNAGLGILVYLIWHFGLLDQALASDTTWITPSIFTLFGGGLLFTWLRVIQCSRALDDIEQFSPTASDSADVLHVKFWARIRPLDWIAYTLITLGFLGTVWGFKIALSGIDPSAVGNVASIGPMVAALVEGMGIALWTTIVGIVTSIALSVNIRLLEGGYDKLFVQHRKNWKYT